MSVYKHILVVLFALSIVSVTACTQDDAFCDDPAGFQGEHGCIYEEDGGEVTGMEDELDDDIKVKEQAGALAGRCSVWFTRWSCTPIGVY